MTEKTISQLSRLLSKVAAKFPAVDEPTVMTDIHLRVNQDTGDVMAFDDNEEEITRIVVDEWISDKENDTEFYSHAAKAIRKLLFGKNEGGVEHGSALGLMQPYSYVLENELGEHIEELYVADADQDTIIVGEPFMVGLSEELDDFIKNLLDE